MFRESRQTETNPRQFSGQLEDCRQQTDSLLAISRALLYVLKECAMDITDLDADAFRRRVEKLANLFRSDETAKAWGRAFDGEKAAILNFIEHQRRCIRDREKELENIVEFLRNSITGMIGESQEFNGQMHERSVRMEQIATLDDIRRIKEGLKSEIGQMKLVVREKRAKDAKRVDSLAREVKDLRSRLEEATEASMTDPLTGVRNRLSFDTYLRKCVDRNLLSWETFSVLMCDIDNFKRINDTYGHQVGDLVLKHFARECTSFVRSDDLVARYGGEEFAIVLRKAPLRGALKTARRVCSAIASAEYIIDHPTVRGSIRYTVSIGVAEARKNDTVETLIERADRALYFAKATGKNRAASEAEAQTADKAA